MVGRPLLSSSKLSCSWPGGLIALTLTLTPLVLGSASCGDDSSSSTGPGGAGPSGTTDGVPRFDETKVPGACVATLLETHVFYRPDLDVPYEATKALAEVGTRFFLEMSAPSFGPTPTYKALGITPSGSFWSLRPNGPSGSSYLPREAFETTCASPFEARYTLLVPATLFADEALTDSPCVLPTGTVLPDDFSSTKVGTAGTRKLAFGSLSASCGFEAGYVASDGLRGTYLAFPGN